MPPYFSIAPSPRPIEFPIVSSSGSMPHKKTRIHEPRFVYIQHPAASPALRPRPRSRVRSLRIHGRPPIQASIAHTRGFMWNNNLSAFGRPLLPAYARRIRLVPAPRHSFDYTYHGSGSAGTPVALAPLLQTGCHHPPPPAHSAAMRAQTAVQMPILRLQSQDRPRASGEQHHCRLWLDV